MLGVNVSVGRQSRLGVLQVSTPPSVTVPLNLTVLSLKGGALQKCSPHPAAVLSSTDNTLACNINTEHL